MIIKLYSKMSKIAQAMLKLVTVICLALLILGLVIISLVYSFEKPLPYIFGIVLGFAHSVIKVLLLESSISLTVKKNKDGAFNMVWLHFVVRFVPTVAVFVLIVMFPGVFGLFGAMAGVLSLQAAALIANIRIRKS